MYLLIPGLTLWVASVFRLDSLAFWALVLIVVFARAGNVFFRVVITLPLIQSVFALRRRDLPRAQRAMLCVINLAATLLWWVYVLSAPSFLLD